MEILGQHYEMEDPRTQAQREADTAYVAGYRSEELAFENRYYSTTRPPSLADSTDEELQKLAAYAGRPSSDFSEEELARIQELNPQASQPRSRWEYDHEELTPMEIYRRSAKLKEDALKVPESMLPYLSDRAQPTYLQRAMNQAREEIVGLAPFTQYRDSLRIDEAESIFEVAKRTLAIRKNNLRLEQAVLEA